MRDDACPISLDRIQQVLLPIAEAAGLPNGAYTASDYFRYERDEVVGRTWAGIAFADSIPARPYAQPVEFMGLPLLVVRDAIGTLRIFHNVCSHRGMILVPEPTDVRGLICCRYHCWAYATNGALKATPHIAGVNHHNSDGFNKTAHGLRLVRSAVFMGVIFVNLSGDAPDFEEFINPLRRRAEQLIGAQGWSQLRPGATDSWLRFDVHCNWKLAVENYCEAYHLPWVHPTLSSYSRLEDHHPFLDMGFAGQTSLAYRPNDAASSRLPRLSAWPVDRTHLAEYPSLYPNVLLGFQADHVFAIILMPLAADLTREEVCISYIGAGASDEEYSAGRSATHAAWHTVLSEDVLMVEGMQLGRASPGYDGGVFSPVMDNATHHFHRWIAERLAARSSVRRS